MANSILIGVDPGLSGAVAVVGYGDAGIRSIELLDMPVIELKTASTGKTYRIVDAASLFWDLKHLARQMSGLTFSEPHITAWIEQVSAMPGQGVSTTFTFGRSLGAIESVMGILGATTHYVRPSVWKKALNLSSDKGASLEAARVAVCRLRLIGTLNDLDRAKDNGRAEALLIALYGATQTGADVPARKRRTR